MVPSRNRQEHNQSINQPANGPKPTILSVPYNYATQFKAIVKCARLDSFLCGRRLIPDRLRMMVYIECMKGVSECNLNSIFVIRLV